MVAAVSVFSGFRTAKRGALRAATTASKRLQCSLFCARDGRETLALRLLISGVEMNRGKLASLIFVGATVLFLAAPSVEGEAKAGPGVIRADEVVAPLSAVAASVEQLPSNAGLKPAATPDLGATGICPEGMLEV